MGHKSFEPFQLAYIRLQLALITLWLALKSLWLAYSWLMYLLVYLAFILGSGISGSYASLGLQVVLARILYTLEYGSFLEKQNDCRVYKIDICTSQSVYKYNISKVDVNVLVSQDTWSTSV